MSARMQVPGTSVRHSNVAVVRLSKHGKKLEVACYKNKVVNYRSGIETRMDEVLQIERVFANVSTGEYASNDDIKKVIGKKMNEMEAVKYVLDHGELQVAQHEREAEVSAMCKDICAVIAQKCVNPATTRPYPAAMIEQAVKALGSTIKLDQPAKKQALQLIHELEASQIIAIERAKMRIRVVAANPAETTSLAEVFVVEHPKSVLEGPLAATLAAETDGSRLLLIPPQFYRDAETVFAGVHVVEHAVMELSGGFVAPSGEALLMGGGGVGSAASGAASGSSLNSYGVPLFTSGGGADLLLRPTVAATTASSAPSSGPASHGRDVRSRDMDSDDDDDDNNGGKRGGGKNRGGKKNAGKKQTSQGPSSQHLSKAAMDSVAAASAHHPHAAAAGSKSSARSESDDGLRNLSAKERRKVRAARKEAAARAQQQQKDDDDIDDEKKGAVVGDDDEAGENENEPISNASRKVKLGDLRRNDKKAGGGRKKLRNAKEEATDTSSEEEFTDSDEEAIAQKKALEAEAAKKKADEAAKKKYYSDDEDDGFDYGSGNDE